MLVGDHPALDFLNTWAFPGGIETEWIGNGRALVQWLSGTGLSGELPDFGKPNEPKVEAALDEIAAEARHFREWLRSYVKYRAGRLGRKPIFAELKPLNGLLLEDAAFRQLALDGAAKIVWSAWQRRTLRPLLLEPIAHAAGDLLVNADFGRIRACAGTGCSLMFLDRTKSGARRWCSMAVCGNRAKASMHRQKRRDC